MIMNTVKVFRGVKIGVGGRSKSIAERISNPVSSKLYPTLDSRIQSLTNRTRLTDSP